MDTIRLLLDRMRGRETVLELDLLGIPMRLAVAARREIRRAREISEESALLDRMFESLTDRDVVYDIGANIGLIAMLLARNPHGRDVRVHAFEPEPRNFRQLERNLSLNELCDRVTPHALALGSEPGEIDLFVRGGPGEGRHSTVESRGSTGSIQVPVTTAAAFSRANCAPPDVVKIDVEGAEGRVLAGLQPLFDDARPRDIFFELHPKGERDRMPEGESIHGWLEQHGYVLRWDHVRGAGRHCHYRR